MAGNVSQAGWQYSGAFAENLNGVCALVKSGSNLIVGADSLAVYPLPGLNSPTSIAINSGVITKIAVTGNYIFARVFEGTSYSLAKFTINPLKAEGVLDAPIYDFDVDDENLYVVANSSTVSVFHQSDLTQKATYNLSEVQYCTMAIANKVLCVASGGKKQNIVQFYSLDGSNKLGELTTDFYSPKMKKTSGENFFLTESAITNLNNVIELYSTRSYTLQTTIDYLSIPGGVTDSSESSKQLFFSGSYGVHMVGNSVSLEKQGSFTLNNSYYLPAAIIAIDDKTVYASAGYNQMGIDKWEKTESKISKE